MLAPGKESYEKPRQHIQKQRHHFASKCQYSQSYGFSITHVLVWNLYHKESKCRRIDAFKSWCWRRFLRVPWTACKSNQSILKEINPEYSLEGLMLKLWKDWCSNTLTTWREKPTHWKRPWCWKRLRLKEKGEAEDEMVRQHHWLKWTWIWANWETLEDRGPWGAVVHGGQKGLDMT